MPRKEHFWSRIFPSYLLCSLVVFILGYFIVAFLLRFKVTLVVSDLVLVEGIRFWQSQLAMFFSISRWSVWPICLGIFCPGKETYLVFQLWIFSRFWGKHFWLSEGCNSTMLSFSLSGLLLIAKRHFMNRANQLKELKTYSWIETYWPRVM